MALARPHGSDHDDPLGERHAMRLGGAGEATKNRRGSLQPSRNRIASKRTPTKACALQSRLAVMHDGQTDLLDTIDTFDEKLLDYERLAAEGELSASDISLLYEHALNVRSVLTFGGYEECLRLAKAVEHAIDLARNEALVLGGDLLQAAIASASLIRSQVTGAYTGNEIQALVEEIETICRASTPTPAAIGFDEAETQLIEAARRAGARVFQVDVEVSPTTNREDLADLPDFQSIRRIGEVLLTTPGSEDFSALSATTNRTVRVLFASSEPTEVVEACVPGARDTGSTEPKASDPSPTGATPTALVVDDDPVGRKVVARTLERQGFAVTTADNGAQALYYFLRSPDFDVVVLDLVMPETTGEEFVKIVHHLQSKGLLPDRRNVIVVSAVISYTQLTDLLRFSCVHTVRRKPVRQEHLKVDVENVRTGKETSSLPSELSSAGTEAPVLRP